MSRWHLPNNYHHNFNNHYDNHMPFNRIGKPFSKPYFAFSRKLFPDTMPGFKLIIGLHNGLCQ